MGNSCAGSNSETKVPIEKDTPPEEETAPPEPSGPQFTIKIMGARGLRNADWLPGMGTSDCFCNVKIAGKDDDSSLFQTKTINDTLTPVWQEEAQIFELAENEDLEFSIWDEDAAKAPDFLGKAVLKYSDFADKGFNGDLKLEEAGKSARAFLRLKVKCGQNDYPAGPPSEFLIAFDKDPTMKTLGLDVDESDGRYLYVMGVKAGPFQAYNDGAETSVQLKPGDFIVRVNDKEGGTEGSAKDMIAELKSSTSYEMLVRRPDEICIAIDKKTKSTPLGLEFPKKPFGNALLIKKVNDGPIKKWNDNVEAAQQVQELDRFVVVQGFQCKAVDLQKKLNKATNFQAVVVRPADPGSSWWF